METQTDAFLAMCCDLHRFPPSEEPKANLAGLSNCHRKLRNVITTKDICIVMGAAKNHSSR